MELTLFCSVHFFAITCLEALDFELKAGYYLAFFSLSASLIALSLTVLPAPTSLIAGGFQGLVLDPLCILSALTASALTSVHLTRI